MLLTNATAAGGSRAQTSGLHKAFEQCFESARLTDAHTLEGFDCGKESLNTGLAPMPVARTAAESQHVYVWTPLGEQKVSAYFAICPTEVVRNDDGRSRDPWPAAIPAYPDT